MLVIRLFYLTKKNIRKTWAKTEITKTQILNTNQYDWRTSDEIGVLEFKRSLRQFT